VTLNDISTRLAKATVVFDDLTTIQHA